MSVKKLKAEIRLDDNQQPSPNFFVKSDISLEDSSSLVCTKQITTPNASGLNINKHKLFLASASPRRQQLLEQIGIIADEIIPANIDESPLKGESVSKMTARLAKDKAQKIATGINEGFVLAADTAIEIGGKTLGKASSADDVMKMISKLSGKKHRVYTSVALIKVTDGKIEKIGLKTSKTILTLKRLTQQELKEYVISGLGVGREGGFNIQTQMESFIKSINGSYSGIIGLPLFETYKLFTGLGFW
jgi:septum formation protein